MKKTDLSFDSKQILEWETFNGFYMAGRYDEGKMDFRKKCTKAFTNKNLRIMKEYYLWLKKEI